MALNHTSEAGDGKVNSAADQEGIYSKLIREYSKEKLKDEDNRSQYVRDLRAAGAINAGILDEIQSFAGRDSQYDGLEITSDKINYHALVRETGSFFTTLSNNKRALKDMYLQEYDVNEALLSSWIDGPLDELTDKQIRNYISSDKNRKAFLENQLGNNSLPPEKSLEAFLKDFNLQKRYDLLTDEGEKADFHAIVQKIQSGQRIDELDLEILFEGSIYNAKEKEKLLNKLVPSITLSQALDFGIITSAQANDLKIQQVKALDDNLSDSEAREIVSQINDEDIKIAMSQFTTHKSNRDRLIENSEIFRDFARKYNQTVDQAQEQIAEGNMRKFSTFMENLERFPTVHGTQNLREGAVFEIKQSVKDESSGTLKEMKLYGEITSLKDDGKIVFIEKHEDGKYDASGSAVTTQSYADFLSYIAAGNPAKGVQMNSMTFLSPSELDAKVRSGDINEYQPKTFKTESSDQINSDIETISQDISRIEEALNDKEVQMRNDLSAQGLSPQEIEQKISEDPWVQKYRGEIQERQDKQQQKLNKLTNIGGNNFEKLLGEINELDADGSSHGLEVGTTIHTKSGELYTVVALDKSGEKIILHSLVGEEAFSYEDFYAAFRGNDAKRINKQNGGFSELVDYIQGNDGYAKSWSTFEFNDGKIKKKDSKKKVDYDYLVGAKDGGDSELLRIEDINGSRVTVSFGQIKTDPKKKGEETFSVENKTYTVTTAFLQEYIKEHKLEPRGLKDNQEVSKEGDSIEKMDRKFHLFSWMFHEKASLNDAIKGGKLFYEQMKEMLEMGSEEKANQFALKYMGGFLTADAKRDLQSRLEQKQKKTMEEYLERLKTVASDVAVDMIDQWLHDKYAPQFQIEAATVFMLEKYGVLNAKALQRYEGKYIFYQALGGTPGDEFFNEIKKEKEDQSLPFTEELLVYLFIKKQCKPGGYKGIQRRSKLHKEVKKIRAVAKDEERETGVRDGNDERDIMGRVKGGIGEMESNNYPNMVGWLEVAVNKGGPMHVLNKIPFLAAFSGIAYNFEEKVTDDLKNFPAKSRLLMMLRFFSYHRDLELLNETIVEVSKSLEARGDPKHAGMGKKAQDIFAQRRDSGGGVKAKLKLAEDFYDQYGKDITNVMYMLNTGEKDDAMNKLIFFEKDEPGKEVFKRYYDALHQFIDADTSFEDEDQMSDPFRGAGTSGLEMHKFAEQQLGLSHGKFKKHTSGPMSWDEIKKEFSTIPHREYHPDPVKNKKFQKKLLVDNLGRMISGIMLSIGTNAKELAGYNTPTGPFNKLNTWGIDMTRFKEASDFSVHGMLHPEHGGDTDTILQEFAQQIIDSEISGINFSHKIKNEFGPNSKLNGTNSNVVSIANSINNTKEKVSHTTSAKIPSLNPDDDEELLAA